MNEQLELTMEVLPDRPIKRFFHQRTSTPADYHAA